MTELATKTYEELYDENEKLRGLVVTLQQKLSDQPSLAVLTATNTHLSNRVLQAEMARDRAVADLEAMAESKTVRVAHSETEAALRTQVAELQEEVRSLQRQLEESDRF